FLFPSAAAHHPPPKDRIMTMMERVAETIPPDGPALDAGLLTPPNGPPALGESLLTPPTEPTAGLPPASWQRSHSDDYRGSRLLETSPCPFISVIVPVRNEEAFLAGTIEQLITQDYPGDRFEVIVVDGRSSDATREIAESLAAVHPNVK